MYILNYKKTVTVFIFSLSLLWYAILCYPKIVSIDLASKVVRLHVRANSDNPQDQKLKLKVRDSIIDYLSCNLQADNQQEAICYIHDNMDTIIATAQKVVLNNGYNYPVNAVLDVTQFPDKEYGSMTFPAGEYCSLNVNIGSGQGHNWWCVLYPPLCLIDDVTAQFPEDSENEIQEAVSENEYKYITQPVFEFKYFTIFNDILECWQ